MRIIKILIWIILIIFPITKSFAAYVTEVDTDQSISFLDGSADIPNGIAFNPNGTKMFVSFQSDFINEYDLSTPFDISTHSYAGDSERCNLANGWSAEAYNEQPTQTGDLTFSSDGLHIFIINRGQSNTDNDALWRYDLTKPFDVSTCTLAQEKDPDALEALNGWRLGSIADNHRYHFAQGVAINPDGTKIFISFNGKGGGAAGDKDSIREYSLSTPYDLSTLTHVDSAGILLTQGNPDSIFFSDNGKRIFVTDHDLYTVTQYSLSIAYDTTSNVKDGAVIIKNFITTKTANQIRALAFSANGLKMFVSDDNGDDSIHEFNLVCPFNIIEGNCPAITEGDRTGLVEAQIEVAKRTIEHSTDTALNRLKWIRRNKDLQNLSYQNIKLNFSNEMLASLAEAIQVSTSPKEKSKNKDIFYWAEGSLAYGRVRETDTSSRKKIYTDGITIGADKFTDKKGIKGLAFRFSQNDVSVGTVGSRLDTDTYNLTYYSTTPVKEDGRFLDAVVGIGALYSDISSVLDGNKLTGNRNGRQIYGTLKLKEEIKKDELTLIPAGQIDLGYTILSDYSESGKTAMRFDKQSIQSRNLRLSLASVEELNNKKYKMKRHGKIEYQANLNRSSNAKYSYIGDSASGNFDTKFTAGALHNINGEVGFDIIYDENFSLFFIYEHNEAIGSGYTQKIHIAIGYLPQKNTNFAFKIEGDDILKSKYIYTKNVNGLDIDFYLLNNDAMRPETFDEIALNLRKVF
ncbi:autotransporter domain-containing protein [Candidatus Pelagibacter sp.]|uniref:autotransporter domain-containing protein n=1 Tax=Candidatus Pelagibacter sp. TaxID=2024849 RepID=UPI003F86BC38